MSAVATPVQSVQVCNKWNTTYPYENSEYKQRNTTTHETYNPYYYCKYQIHDKLDPI